MLIVPDLKKEARSAPGIMHTTSFWMKKPTQCDSFYDEIYNVFMDLYMRNRGIDLQWHKLLINL